MIRKLKLNRQCRWAQLDLSLEKAMMQNLIREFKNELEIFLEFAEVE